MCGIVAYVGPKDAAPILLEGLQRLEYRGYDSAGVVVSNKGLKMRKVKGRVADLAARSCRRGSRAALGIGHTRWATHGVPSDVNAHPHLSADERIAVVHNGIIENADELRAKLSADGVGLRVRDRHRGARPPDRPRRRGDRLAGGGRPQGAQERRRHVRHRGDRRRAARRGGRGAATAARS